jgi:hypothetical protein
MTVFTETTEFRNLNAQGKVVNLTADLCSGSIVIRRNLLGSNVDVAVPESGIYELAVNSELVTVVVTGDAKFALS